MEAELNWKNAIITVLRRAHAPMHYVDIAEQIFSQKLKTGQSATPSNTVAATIAQSFKFEKDESPFVRVSPGIYELRSNHSVAEIATVAEKELAETESSGVTGVVNAFGMFWDRDKVLWESEPAILGQQQTGSKPVDFGTQKGVYLLHDSQGVVYVGRTTDQSLGKRLQQHTANRLAGRWTRFSWFGVYPVEENGALRTSADFANLDIDIVIATMEAVLIEGLEPRQNRKRGDDFKAVEFLQVEDPRFERDRKKAIAQELLASLR